MSKWSQLVCLQTTHRLQNNTTNLGSFTQVGRTISWSNTLISGEKFNVMMNTTQMSYINKCNITRQPHLMCCHYESYFNDDNFTTQYEPLSVSQNLKQLSWRNLWWRNKVISKECQGRLTPRPFPSKVKDSKPQPNYFQLLTED